jgi:hypothetical protein
MSKPPSSFQRFQARFFSLSFREVVLVATIPLWAIGVWQTIATGAVHPLLPIAAVATLVCITSASS